MVIAIIFTVFVVFPMIYFGHVTGVWPKALTPKRFTPALSGPTLSRVSQQLLREYSAIPEESRPFPEIETILAGLDEKTSHDTHQRYIHFDNNWMFGQNRRLVYSNFEFSWKPQWGRCNHSKFACKFHEYYDLHLAIKTVRDSLDKKERALLESKTQVHSDMAKELMAALRNEAGIQDQFVQTYKSLE